MMGSPSVMMLDEPTTGVDPAARRKIWDTITNIRKMGTSIVMTLMIANILDIVILVITRNKAPLILCTPAIVFS